MSSPVENSTMDSPAAASAGQASDLRSMRRQQQSPQLQRQQQQQPQQPQRGVSPHSPAPSQSPHSTRERTRRGHSPLAVLINPPSLDESATPAGIVDSLALALEELRAGGGLCLTAFNNSPDGARVTDSARGGGAAVATCSTSAACNSSGGSSGYRSDDELLSVRPIAKRSSSLKSKKTPPGTPTQVKKAVRFADAFGLDLTNVKHVFDLENPPEIPPQATQDLELDDEDDVAGFGRPSAQPRTSLSLPLSLVTAAAAASAAASAAPFAATFAAASAASVDGGEDRGRWRATASSAATACVVRPAFSQPGNSAGFDARVMAQKVVLESVTFTPPAEVRGYIRVTNLAFEKAVTVRFTCDNWRSSTEVVAAYVPNSSSGMTDKFAFTAALPEHALQLPGVARVAFCIAYNVCGQTFWDNNFGENYAFDCVPATATDAWGQRF